MLADNERQELVRYWQSKPDTPDHVLKLMLLLIETLSEGDLEQLKKDVIYGKLFQDEILVGNKIEKLMSKTLTHVRKFIAVEVFAGQMNELQLLQYLQTYYNNQNKPNLFLSVSNQMKKLAPTRAQDYYMKFLGENQIFIFNSKQNFRKDDLNIENTIKALDTSYLVERLWLMCGLLNQTQVAPIENLEKEGIVSIDFFTQHYKWFFEMPIGQLFKQAIELLTKSSDEKLKQLQDFIELLYLNESQIITDCINLFEVTACNYGIKQINKGKINYLKPVFDIQKRRISSSRIYQKNGTISAAEFVSVLSIGFRLSELPWVQSFIEDHKKKILGVMPSQQYYEYALANYFFYSKDYQETCRILMTSDYEDVQCRMLARFLEIKSLSEQYFRQNGDHRICEYLEDRTEAAVLFFFRQKDLESTKKKMGKRFADTMKRIIHADGKRDAERLKIILNDIAKAEFIAERQWLTKLTEDLIARHS